jgi:S1-C subfamily serine protease
LGDEKLLHIGDPLTTAGFPLNLDKMFFRGYVACLQNPDRPLLVDMVFSYGSSGSGVFSENQEALVGIATDMYEDTDNDRVISSAVPVSKLKILLDSIQRPL